MLSLIIVFVVCCSSTINAQSTQPIVKIDGCSILGNWDTYHLNVAQFLSVPYSQPPIGDLRWKPSVPIYNYSDTANVCTNNNLINATYHHSRCWSPFTPPNDTWPSQNEDCVHIDIYSPSFKASPPVQLPVLVYFPGGSSVSGGNFQYDFTNLSVALQVVVVVPNSRLALLGYLSFEALTQTSNTTPKQSGNYGLMDTKLSLEWIKQHIAKFGGDPQDVTIMGQSTGGTVVLAMYAMPSSKGLFNRGISISGSPNISMDLHSAEVQGQSIVDVFNCDKGNNQDVVSCMKSIPAQTFTQYYPQQWSDADDKNFGIPGPNKTGFDEAGLVIVDGYLITQPISDALHNGIIDLPLMLGNTAQESDFAPYTKVVNLTTEAEFSDYLNAQFAEWSPDFGTDLWKTYYSEEWGLGGSQLVYDSIGTDSTGFCGSKYLATVASDSDEFSSNVYVFSHQQWPSHPFQNNYPEQGTLWDCRYAFHSIGFQFATFSWNSFEYWGAVGYEPQYSDLGFGQLLREHWSHFILYDTPMNSWKRYNKESNYSVALLGNGPDKSTKYNFTNSTVNYKTEICQYYLDNDIGPNFWWTN